ncbi:MAPEG family protein [Pseudoxanthobacter sp.]|uniref:MAPEG family protein n=1 Tax=Pseudoxanthobacter sp. TaxID=1925742 RepID=UPI002FE185CB
MSIADWCILAAVFLTYLVLIPAKLDPAFDNREPRTVHAAQTGLRRRAWSAHLNGFEALPFFIGAVILAEMNGGPQNCINGSALAFVVARAVYGAAYLADRPRLRSLSWLVGFVSTIAIFLSPLWG